MWMVRKQITRIATTLGAAHSRRRAMNLSTGGSNALPTRKSRPGVAGAMHCACGLGSLLHPDNVPQWELPPGENVMNANRGDVDQRVLVKRERWQVASEDFLYLVV